MMPRLSISRSEYDTLTAQIASRAWGTGEVGIILGTHLMLFCLASFTGLFFYEEQIPFVQLVVTYLIYVIMTGLVYFITRRRGGSWADSFGLGRPQLKYFAFSPLFYLAVLPLLILVANAWHLLLGAAGEAVELQDVAKAITDDTSWLQGFYIFTAILIAPLFEEIIFRGVIFPFLMKGLGVTRAVWLASAFFALMHFHLPSFMPLMLLSAALCLAYWRTGSLWICIGTHAVFNAVNTLALNNQG